MISSNLLNVSKFFQTGKEVIIVKVFNSFPYIKRSQRYYEISLLIEKLIDKCGFIFYSKNLK